MKPVGDMTWQEKAACKPPSAMTRREVKRNVDPFFPNSRDEKVLPIHEQICGACPVNVACLEFAIANPGDGIWAATNQKDRRRIARERERAA